GAAAQRSGNTRSGNLAISKSLHKFDKVVNLMPTDRELGLHRRITRRDFLNGCSIAATAIGAADEWPEGARPCDLARKPWVRIAIANSDSAAAAYTGHAIDQAFRAVEELLGPRKNG